MAQARNVIAEFLPTQPPPPGSEYYAGSFKQTSCNAPGGGFAYGPNGACAVTGNSGSNAIQSGATGGLYVSLQESTNNIGVRSYINGGTADWINFFSGTIGGVGSSFSVTYNNSDVRQPPCPIADEPATTTFQIERLDQFVISGTFHASFKYIDSRSGTGPPNFCRGVVSQGTVSGTFELLRIQGVFPSATALKGGVGCIYSWALDTFYILNGPPATGPNLEQVNFEFGTAGSCHYTLFPRLGAIPSIDDPFEDF